MKFAKTHPMRPAAMLAILVIAPLASACGTASTSATASHAVRPANPPNAGSAPATASTVSATTPTTPITAGSGSPSGPPPCRAADLSLSFLGGQGATGHGELGFTLRNTSGQACSTIGYPGVQFLDKSGNALPTIPTHTSRDFFGSVPKGPVTIAPGATASFRLGVTHGMTSTVGCTTAYGLQVIPPNDTATLRTPIPNGAYECQTATVSPLAPGAMAYT